MSEKVHKPVLSPCISLCALDEDDICIGCYRSAEEIRVWSGLDNAQRRRILRLVYEREKKENPFL